MTKRVKQCLDGLGRAGSHRVAFKVPFKTSKSINGGSYEPHPCIAQTLNKPEADVGTRKGPTGEARARRPGAGRRRERGVEWAAPCLAQHSVG
jgi:hypothetical protein